MYKLLTSLYVEREKEIKSVLSLHLIAENNPSLGF